MKVGALWAESIPSKDPAVDPTVFDLAFSPDGRLMIAAVANRVLVYDVASGNILHTLKGHKDTVYCTAFARDGKRFASGGADKTVILWRNQNEGFLKYTHADSIQALAFNPSSQQLVSATESEFGLWAPEQKAVTKIKVASKITCVAWSSDGHLLALGHYNGTISIRDSRGVEKVSFQRNGPISCLQFAPQTPGGESEPDLLAVGAWDQSLSFYTLDGPIGKERALGYDPCSLSFICDSSYILCGGSDCGVSLYTRDGHFLKLLTSTEDWVWAVRVRPAAPGQPHQHFALGTNGGQVALFEATPNTVHGLHHDRYAHREDMTEVMIQHLITDEKVRIKARDYVKKISLFRGRLAIQLPDRVLIYQTVTSPASTNSLGGPLAGNGAAQTLVEAAHTHSEGARRVMQYRLAHKITAAGADGDGNVPLRTRMTGTQRGPVATHMLDTDSEHVGTMDCSLLLLTSRHLVLCQDHRLRLIDDTGALVREWALDAVVRYVRVAGGSAGHESLLVGLRNGHIVQVFLDAQHQFPVTLIRHDAAIRSLDISADRSKVALIDEHFKLCVYSLATQSLVYEDAPATSLAWNSAYADMLCYSGDGFLSIKAGSFPLHRQPLSGYVVGFRGSRIFCLHRQTMHTHDVPLSATLAQHLAVGDYPGACEVANLGVTESDWRLLAHRALLGLDLATARKAFVRLRDTRFLTLVARIEVARGATPPAELPRADKLFLAEIKAYQGDYAGAAQGFLDAGEANRAVEMYLDLRDWVRAKEVMARAGSGSDSNELIRRQAQWLLDGGDTRGAADMLWAAGEYARAIDLWATNGWVDDLIARVRELPVTEPTRPVLASAAQLLIKLEEPRAALELYLRLEDLVQMMTLLVQLQHWDEALQLLDQVKANPAADPALAPALAALFYLPYAEWLALRGRFAEAHEAFLKAGRGSQARRLLAHLALNAIRRKRFSDAGHFYALLAAQQSKAAAQGAATLSAGALAALRSRAQWFSEQAAIYRAYSVVREAASPEPVVCADTLTLLHCAQTVINTLAVRSQQAAHALLLQQMATDAAAAVPGAVPLPRIDPLAHPTAGVLPAGVSFVDCLIVFARAATRVGAYKTARQVYARLGSFVLSERVRSEVEIAQLMMRSKPYTDAETAVPVCARCQSANALLYTGAGPAAAAVMGTEGQWYGAVSLAARCVHCGFETLRSALSFEPLPLVEFRPVADDAVNTAAATAGPSQASSSAAIAAAVAAAVPLGRAEAQRLIARDPSTLLTPANAAEHASSSRARAVTLADLPELDSFHLHLLHPGAQLEPGNWKPILIGPTALTAMPPREVFVVDDGDAPPSADASANSGVKSVARYFRNTMADVAVVQCKQYAPQTGCNAFFLIDEFETAMMEDRFCPVCRTKIEDHGF
jgi:intraflagellar transport protein 122